MRALGVVKCQLALVRLALRSCSQAAISSTRVCLSGIRRVEALGRQDAEFGLRQIKPTAMLWSVVPFEALDQPPGFEGGKASLYEAFAMRLTRVDQAGAQHSLSSIDAEDASRSGTRNAPLTPFL
jgi:hypothetical protein